MSATESSITAWEQAYLRFESPTAERAKFVRRLTQLGVTEWDRNLRILEICCGRGNGLAAWHALGFANVDGLDLSAELAAQYRGAGQILVGDARQLPLATATYDVVAVQGGLHHLNLPEDLQRTVAEVRRVLKPGGRFLVVEPWLTAFLQVVHAACRIGLCRRLWPKLDALATMIEHEQVTYESWLNQPQSILATLDRHFTPEHRSMQLGKLTMIGRKAA